MAIHEKQINQLIEALIENILAIEICISFNKKEDSEWDFDTGEGVLGTPAMILICSVIDTVGSYFRGSNQEISIDSTKFKIETADGHFYILNHEKFFNLHLSKNAIDDFYSTFRCKLTHNNSLPENNILSLGTDASPCFELDVNGLIQKVNIKPLFNLTVISVGQFLDYLISSTFSADHKVTKELIAKAKSNILKSYSLGDTGHTETISATLTS